MRVNKVRAATEEVLVLRKHFQTGQLMSSSPSLAGEYIYMALPDGGIARLHDGMYYSAEQIAVWKFFPVPHSVTYEIG
jgi:hypothetical protein